MCEVKKDVVWCGEFEKTQDKGHESYLMAGRLKALMYKIGININGITQLSPTLGQGHLLIRTT